MLLIGARFFCFVCGACVAPVGKESKGKSEDALLLCVFAMSSTNFPQPTPMSWKVHNTQSPSHLKAAAFSATAPRIVHNGLW